MTSGKPALSPAIARTLMIMQTIAHRIRRDGRGPLWWLAGVGAVYGVGWLAWSLTGHRSAWSSGSPS